MSDFTSVTIGGRLTRDPEVRFTPSGTACCKWSVAVATTKKVGGEYTKVPIYLDCEAFGKLAEFTGKHFAKGKAIVVAGKFANGDYEKDGAKIKKLLLIADAVYFGDSPVKATTPKQEEVPW